MDTKPAAGTGNDDHIRKWRGSKGYRYNPYEKSYKAPESRMRAKPVAVFTDMPVSNISMKTLSDPLLFC